MMPEFPRCYGRIRRVPGVSRPLRLLVYALFALALAALLWVVSGTLHSLVGLWQSLRELPPWARWSALVLILILLLAGGVFGWRLLRPRRRREIRAAPTREQIDERLVHLHRQQADTAALQAELEELDRRARSEELYVAVFGEISAGKSSLIRALLPQAAPQTDVLGGTTRAVAHYRGGLSDTVALTFADVPGTHEASGAAREQLARDEALRAHAVIYVCNGDLTRDQDAELRWLRGFGKPLLLVLNKADRFRAAERETLQATLRSRYGDVTDAQVVVSAGGNEAFERRLPDGRVEHVQRERAADVVALHDLLARIAAPGAAELESSRQAAVLTAIGTKADALEAQTRERQAEAIVNKYTRRAVVGALAAVMPGSDLVVQGVLATALIRELARLHDVGVRELDVDAFLGKVKLTVRTSTSLVLAIAGNAAKAFPGLGTLGGGVLHAIGAPTHTPL